MKHSPLRRSTIDFDFVQRNEDPNVAYFNADELSFPLLIRPFKSGDRFLPFGMDGSMKVSDFFTNSKVPTLAREYWPLLCEEEEILWIVGHRQSNLRQIKEQTKEVAVFRIDSMREDDET